MIKNRKNEFTKVQNPLRHEFMPLWTDLAWRHDLWQFNSRQLPHRTLTAYAWLITHAHFPHVTSPLPKALLSPYGVETQLSGLAVYPSDHRWWMGSFDCLYVLFCCIVLFWFVSFTCPLYAFCFVVMCLVLFCCIVLSLLSFVLL